MTGLIADIGGTNARFALTTPEGHWRDERVFRCADHAGLAAAAQAYLDGVLAPDEAPPTRAAACVAAPVTGDAVTLTNWREWSFSIEQTRKTLGLEAFTVVNDFVANALAVPRLGPGHVMDLGGGPGDPTAPIGVVGPGTGLGVAVLLPGTGQAIATEGGHVTLAATTPREAEVVAALQARFGHASAERAASGPGLLALAETLRALGGHDPVPGDTPARIMERSLNGTCPVCAEASALFYAFLGTMCGNLVLSAGAWGGLWLMGGILPRNPEALKASVFTERYAAKGRFRAQLEAVPRRLVLHPYPAFVGLTGLVAASA
ncbi:glucokinase [Pararhodospirillum oryzae]|uniref:Glucokinase n=1 Tax=Pararhodospirillum oryzae TaxID=478448 RepID=A0A512H7G1_9PROT|nr:glucokinase [Pararhodospirillum oryzae]GEO81374.1 glucokinase [Pararhodospirillum oryzae]